MRSEKQKLIMAAACLAAVMVLMHLMAWAFPNLHRTSPALSVASFVVLFVPMAVSMFYLSGTLMRFIVGKLVDLDERQKALQLSRRQQIGRALRAWLLLACAFILVLGGLMQLPQSWALSRRGVSVQGQVFKVEKQAGIHYRFRVGPKVYTGSDFSQSPQKLKPGAHVAVLYDPQNPQVSTLDPSKAQLNDALMFLVAVVLFFPAMMMASYKYFLLPGWKRTLMKHKKA
jgi:hypothetical protein